MMMMMMMMIIIIIIIIIIIMYVALRTRRIALTVIVFVSLISALFV